MKLWGEETVLKAARVKNHLLRNSNNKIHQNFSAKIWSVVLYDPKSKSLTVILIYSEFSNINTMQGKHKVVHEHLTVLHRKERKTITTQE